jgi:hypothetical protein
MRSNPGRIEFLFYGFMQSSCFTLYKGLLKQRFTFFEGLLPYTPFQDPTLRGASVASGITDCRKLKSMMLVLPPMA